MKKEHIDDLGVVGIVVADWDFEKSFKPKTITTDYSTWICYISRRPVPAKTPITDNNYWKPLFRLDREIAYDYESFKDYVRRNIEDIKNQIDSMEITGIAVSNQFGSEEHDKHIAPSNYIVTNAFTKIWQKLEDMTGESLQGITMSITPEYFIGEDGCDIHITANTVETNGIFEQIRFLINGAEIYSAENVDVLEYNTHIDETSVIRCEAKIMGVWYNRQSIITHYNSFWLGAGTSYTGIMDVEHVIPITNGMRGAYNVNVNDGDNLFIIIGNSLAQGFIRADMNSIEIPFVESTVEIENETYKVYTSVNTYNAGIYNIDING